MDTNEHKFPKIIHVQSTQETVCHQNPNSLYRLSSPPTRRSQESPVSDQKERSRTLQSYPDEETTFSRNGAEVEVENMNTQSEATAITPDCNQTKEYNPSEVFLSWLNEGTTPRPSTNSRKIRLTYSSISPTGTDGNQGVISATSSDTSLPHRPRDVEVNSVIEDDQFRSRSSGSSSSLSSSFSATFNAIFSHNRSSRRNSRYFFNQDSLLNIPLVEMQNGTNEQPVEEKIITRYGPELV